MSIGVSVKIHNPQTVMNYFASDSVNNYIYCFVTKASLSLTKCAGLPLAIYNLGNIRRSVLRGKISESEIKRVILNIDCVGSFSVFTDRPDFPGDEKKEYKGFHVRFKEECKNNSYTIIKDRINIWRVNNNMTGKNLKENH